MHTARVPSGVGKVWWSLSSGEMVFESAAFQNAAGSEMVWWTMMYMNPSEYE
jgi:hypothetical protein